MGQLLKRLYYQASSPEFMTWEEGAIIEELVASDTFKTNVLQLGVWQLMGTNYRAV